MKLAVIVDRSQCPHRTDTGDGWGPNFEFCEHPTRKRSKGSHVCESGGGFPSHCPLPDARATMRS